MVYFDEKSDALFPELPPPRMLDTQNTARTAVATRAPAFPARVRQLMIPPALTTPTKMESIACARIARTVNHEKRYFFTYYNTCTVEPIMHVFSPSRTHVQAGSRDTKQWRHKPYINNKKEKMLACT